jgi:hypothetical protein
VDPLERSDQPSVRIGWFDSVFERARHLGGPEGSTGGMDPWDGPTGTLFVLTGSHITRMDLRYLEQRLILLARRTGHAVWDQASAPRASAPEVEWLDLVLREGVRLVSTSGQSRPQRAQP